MQTVNRERDEDRVVDAEEQQVGRSERRVHASVGGGVIVLAALFVSMPLATSRLGIPAFLALYAAALAVWLTFSRLRRLHESPPSFAAAATAAILLRVAFMPFDPSLSQDAQRYRWDGLVALSGVSPYAYPPAAPELAHLRPAWHALINHPEIATIYPPAAQGLFALLAGAGGSLFAWRLLLLAFDLATIRMLAPRQAWLWATCPLVVIEGFWSAHLEIVAAALLLASFRAATRHDAVLGGIATGLAGGVKVVPLAALPALASASPRRALFVAIAIVTLAAPLLPFVAIGPLMPGFGDYARRWEFNAPLYEATRWFADMTRLDDATKLLFGAIKDPLHADAVAPFVYAQLHPERMARAICAIAFLAGLLGAMRLPSPASRVAWSVAALLLCAPALHPWYWLTLLPVALEARSRLLVALSVASPASYLLYLGLPAAGHLAAAATYLLPLAATIALRRTMSSSPASGTAKSHDSA